VRRRDLIRLISTSAVWPITAQAASKLPIIGVLGSASAEGLKQPLAAYKDGLSEVGYRENDNVHIEYRWAENKYDLLPRLVADLLEVNVDVIFATGGPASALAAKKATSKIPIVFPAVSYAVELGLVESFNKPGGNVTGIDAFPAELDAKRLQLLNDLVPSAQIIGVLLNPNRPFSDQQASDIEQAAREIAKTVSIIRVSSEGEFEQAFSRLSEAHVEALLVPADPFLHSRREQIVNLAARYKLPAIYQWRDFVIVGGLMSYGASLESAYRQAGIYTGRILNGTRPADLPVQQPTNLELVINLKTAKALGLTVPQSLLARADEVIE
jgi:putative ABC transport system substrate-binding protein